MPSEQRQHDEARIRRFTRRVAVGAVAATGLFGGLAAAASHQPSTTTSDDSGSTSVDTGTSQGGDTFSAPTQSYQPPVAQSGGS